MVPMHNVSITYENCPFYSILQLAHVSGPMIAHQHIDRRRRDPLDVLAVLQSVFLEEMIGKKQHVGFSLSEGRHKYSKHIEPIVEILPESPFANRLFQVFVGGGN